MVQLDRVCLPVVCADGKCAPCLPVVRLLSRPCSPVSSQGGARLYRTPVAGWHRAVLRDRALATPVLQQPGEDLYD